MKTFTVNDRTGIFYHEMTVIAPSEHRFDCYPQPCTRARTSASTTHPAPVLHRLRVHLLVHVHGQDADDQSVELDLRCGEVRCGEVRCGACGRACVRACGQAGKRASGRRAGNTQVSALSFQPLINVVRPCMRVKVHGDSFVHE